MMMLRSHTLWMMLLGWLLCLSPVWAQTKIHYVTADGQPLPTGQGYQEAWTKAENVTTLENALANAKAGELVWIKGYEVGSAEAKTVYRAPEGGFKVKSGVKVYGGFSGKETETKARITDGQLYRMRYRTVLTGDTGGEAADAQDPVHYIFPTSTMNNRTDNRTHVVDIDMTPSPASGNVNKEPTVLNGIVIARGHADGTDEVGGGVYIHGNNENGGIFRLERCFFIANYGTMGGAVYVASEVKNVNGGGNLIDHCSFFNNAAGKREESANRGAAVCLMGEGYVMNSTIYNNANGGVIATKSGSAIVNCTITRNTGAGVDGYGTATDEHLPVYNSVVWGNAMLSTATADQKNFPAFQYSAFPEAGTLGLDLNEQGNNVVLSDKNNDPGDAAKKLPKGPSFTLPSIKIGYDVDFNIQEEAYPQWNWEPLEETSLVDKGNDKLYESIKLSNRPDEDLNGHVRKAGSSIDIGAYEFQPLAEGRRRYVMEKAQGKGDGSSWENASNDLQKMIDALATTGAGPGEVWVAGGTYKPNQKLMDNADYSVAFCMRDGISVYGGFLGKETRKDDRPAMDFPWEPGTAESIVFLTGLEYNPETPEGAAKLENNRWKVSSHSRHVVWFAPETYSKADAPAFKYPTILDRVCVRGGNASGATSDTPGYESGKGGGVYMNDANAYMRNCVVKESSAKLEGGGVYLKNGRIIGSLIYNCNAGVDLETGKGGGVYVNDVGMVLRSMVTNNTADLGAGVYLHNVDEAQPNYLVLSTSVVSNNTARINGAVYCHNGGVLTQNTITNNYCPTAPDQANKEAAQTGGVYVNTQGTVINSVIWNNKIDLTGKGKDNATDIPVYALNPSEAQVRFLYNAISSQNNAVWNNIIQQGTLVLGDKNSTTAEQMGPDFGNKLVAAPGIGKPEEQITDKSLEQNVGALGDVTWIRYYWRPKDGSNLWASGMPIGQFPEDVLMTPELDITALDLFDQKPAIGAFQVKSVGVEPERDPTNKQLIFYVDAENTAIDGNGSSWDKANRSITEVINYYANLTEKQTTGYDKLLIRVKGQEIWPRYAFSNDDPKSATLKIPATRSGLPIVIEGSWHVEGDRAERNPLQFRTILNANHDGRIMSDGLYHAVNISPNAKVEIDGFHIINGYAAENSTASIQSGAGVLAKAGSVVTLRNCILENNTAHTAAAVDARQANSLTMVNCVVNNNTNDAANEPVVGVPTAGTYSFNHLTVVNNKGAAPAGLSKDNNSFAAGNETTAGNRAAAGNSQPTLATVGKDGALNFTNPTNKVGATLGFDTYLGGYSEFRPLTSSEAAGAIINKGTATGGNALSADITMVRDRDLGGMPDLGAFEADLPKKGRVYYVRTLEAGGNDSHNGLSWETAFATIGKAVETANVGTVVNGEKPQVWVAAGTYQQDPKEGSVNCFEILDGVNVFGAFPKKGTPGMGDRHPFVSNKIYYDQTNANLTPDKYETILQPKTSTKHCRVLGQADKFNPALYLKWEKETGYYKWFDNENETLNDKSGNNSKKLIEVGKGKGQYSIEEYWEWFQWKKYWKKDPNGTYAEFTKSGYYAVNQNIPDAHYFEKGHTYVNNNVDLGSDPPEFSYPTTWDGFTLQNGKLTQGVTNSNRNGGAGAVIFRNVTLKNCIVTDCNYTASDVQQIRAAGVYCDEGTVVNCYIQNNTLTNNINDSDNSTSYGAGIYLYSGTMYNCVINGNVGKGYHTDGAGIFIENGKFFNNTVVGNTSEGTTRGNGGICVYYKAEESEIGSHLVLYNCISVGNNNIKGSLKGNADVALNGGESKMKSFNCIYGSIPTDGGANFEFNNCKTSTTKDLFVDSESAQKNFRLKSGCVALNMGEDEPKVNGEHIVLMDYTDMDFTDRIKDCRVDAGAYESENETNFECTRKSKNVNNKTVIIATYYVTQTGAGTSSGKDLENAACAMKLQKVLNHAGQTAMTLAEKSINDFEVIVKVAGYEGYKFVYHANTLSDPNDPQSYTFVVPYGVTLMGGYNEAEKNWDDDHRNAAQYMTVFSAIKKGTTTQDVNGYHALTFGEKPEGWPQNKAKTTLVDGIYLEDGAATSLVPLGDPRTRGGGAIVPAWAHLRNCVVRNNRARQGGGLYVLPGGLVTGCGIMQNTATDEGGGVFADNADVSKSNRGHLVSNTIVENKAAMGGGIYLQDGAALTANTVIWGNTAGSDKNISGAVKFTFADDLFTKLQQTVKSWYPFNNCYAEQITLPSNFLNAVMTSSKQSYFGQFFTLKPYSILIDKGMVERIQDALEKEVGLAAYDMQGIPRKGSVSTLQTEKPIDVGAYAYAGGVMPTNAIVDRLFVSPANNVVVEPTDTLDENDFMGKSFYTSFTTLEDALEYIEAVRKDTKEGSNARQTTFEILMAQGTYIPQRQRANAAMQTYDQRLNSFTIPYNVHIYGGFRGDELYSSFDKDTELPIQGGSLLKLTAKDSIQTLCEARSRTDHNNNGLLEPWELTVQTKLSGELNLSATEQNAYHVIFSERAKAEGVPEAQRVLLDGLIVTKGHTHNSLKNEAAERTENEVGRGGGIYSKGIEYVLANCRLIENKAVRGGGIFIWDADCYLFNTLVAGNEVEKGVQDEDVAFGGGVFLAATKDQHGKQKEFHLRAINNLFVNNTSAQTGGALAVGNSSDPNAPKYIVNLANTTIARNKAEQSPVIFNSNGTSNLVNVLMWGNEGEANEANAIPNISFSVSDVDYHGSFKAENTHHNHLIESDNDHKNGPHFQKPAKEPGAVGYAPDNSWNPVAISVATDNGNGILNAEGYFEGDEPNYENCWKTFIPKNLQGYKNVYVKGRDGADYKRYSGPIDLESGTIKDRPIDVGFYEYQYISNFQTMPNIFVAEQSSGLGNGSSWENATDDLRGAIIGASHPKENVGEDRTIYVKSGNYASLLVDGLGTAFPISTSNPNEQNQLNLTIKGACVGENGTSDKQDFSKPSYIMPHPKKMADTKQLMAISVNSAKTVTIEGFSFTNPTTIQDGGVGVTITHVADGGKVALRQSAFRMNKTAGLQVGKDAFKKGGKLLAVNTLFADNATGLENQTGDNITLVNTTFANNTKADMNQSVANTFNSVSWNNGANKLPETPDQGNKVFTFTGEAAANNADVLKGPNFRDPLNTDEAKRDYRIRPSLCLLEKGNNAHYVQHALGQSEPNSQIPETEKDLYNTNRKVGERIDIGAYEYEALLQPIAYVKSSLATGTADGSNWDNATGDLQGAVDLAGVYANNNSDKPAYVFADRNVKPMGTLRITLPNVKVYGGMNGEVHLAEVDGKQQAVSQPTDQIEAETIVRDMLQKRAGLLMQSDRSTLQVLQLDATDAVVDGFEIAGGAEVNQGTLATSIVGSTNVGKAVTGKTDGTLYNSLVYGNVSGVKAVNVTATGTITDAIQGSGNNRAKVSEANKYVRTDHWKYQLNETDTDNLNKGTVGLGSLDTPTSIIASVGHNRDLIGNLRVRDVVDNGCFETWYLPEGGKVTPDDYPMGQSVVYVGSGKELLLNYQSGEASGLTFSPGFLLLAHQAGLRGNGHKVKLTNFAVERCLPKAATTPPQTEGAAADAKVYDLAVMPFTVTKAEGLADDKVTDGAKLYSYDSKARASFVYKFNKEKGAWVDTKHTNQRDRLTIGWLIEGKPETKVRFYGTSYEENGQPKPLRLKKENHNQPWATPSDKGDKFTHKENMSWNLFGSPYLCAMKYADMGYGRVMYSMPDHDDYVTVQTYDDKTDAVVEGYIPAGDAVFTQTATLKDYEELNIAQPAETNALSEGEIPYAGQQALQVALTRTLDTRNDAAADEAADVLQLRAVDEAEARTDFDLGSDGVKWNSPNGVPQIYALQNSGRYSLLSAVNREGSVQVGVQLPAAGNYRFFLPEECDLTDYEVVMLHDAQTGQSTDLTESAYAFSTVEGGDVEARFTLSFVRKDSPLTQGIRVRRLSERSFRIEGTQPGDQIRLFGTDGRQVAAQTALAATETVEAYMPITAIVEVKRNGRPVGVVKVR